MRHPSPARRPALLPARLPVTLLLVVAPLLVACGSSAAGDAGDGAKADEGTVPAGVVKQYRTLAAEVDERGGHTTSGEWTVSYIVEAAEPWFEGHGGHAAYRAPAQGETHHIEIIPTETATGRIVPDVPITLEVVDADGTVVQKQRLDFYHSTFFHYANNFTIPESGEYTLRATLGSPAFNRHGEEQEGPALASGATVEFPGVSLTS